MEQIKNFENYVDAMLQELESKTKVFKELKLLLNSNVIKEGSNLLSSIKPDRENSYTRRIRQVPTEYPRRGTSRDKIRYIMNHFSKAIQYSDMKNLIIEHEGNKAQKWFDGIERALRGLTHPQTGEMIYYNYKNSKYRFYIKPDWLTEDKNDVLPQFAPDFNIINDISKEEVIPENIEFHMSK